MVASTVKINKFESLGMLASDIPGTHTEKNSRNSDNSFCKELIDFLPNGVLANMFLLKHTKRRTVKEAIVNPIEIWISAFFLKSDQQRASVFTPA